MNEAQYWKEAFETFGITKPEAQSMMDRQREAFREKFGRLPGPTDPFFFDPDSDTPKQMNKKQIRGWFLRELARERGVSSDLARGSRR